MAKRVIAYSFDAGELAELQARVKNPYTTESSIVGDLDLADIEALRKKGIAIDVMDDAGSGAGTSSGPPKHVSKPQDPAPTLPKLQAPQPTLWGRFKSIFSKPSDMQTADVPVPEITVGQPKSLESARRYPFLVTLKGPLVESWRRQLDALGVQFVEWREGRPPLLRSGYIARLSQDQVLGVQSLEFVEYVGLYDYADTPRLEANRGVAGAAGHSASSVIRCHTAEDREEIVRWLQQKGIAITAQGGTKIRADLDVASGLADELRDLIGVAEIEEYVEPQLYNDLSREIIGLSSPAVAVAGDALGLTGAGQIVAVADTGLDSTHPDFADRVSQLIARGRPGKANDPNGHGTHVCGSVLGSGQASDGRYRGTAPGAQCVFQALLDGAGRLSGLPADLGELFEEAYGHGARIHNNSWGADTASNYTFTSREVDEFVARRRDMLVVIAAGNEGTAAIRVKTPPGYVDWSSLSSPATAKNALTVGASRSNRSEGGFASRTHKEVWKKDFPDKPIGEQNVSGNAQEMAGFSSRGPCDDRRIKPDIVAPGTDIMSARSADAPDTSFWGLDPGGKYGYMGGTSMATPLVAGCAALVREYFVEHRRVERPSAALLKATLINGTVWLDGVSSTADHPLMPNYHQGFGRVSMPMTVPHGAGIRLAFEDNWRVPERHFRSTGQRARFMLRAAAPGQELRVCLAWTDLPGRGLQNGLGLAVQGPDGGRIFGNADRRPEDKLQSDFDRDNNVQVVRYRAAAAGDYIVTIFARNLLKPGQDYALVVTGELKSDSLTRVS